MVDIPGYLLAAPASEVGPPVLVRPQVLPLDQLPWPDFERLILRIVRFYAAPEHCQLYGVAGQAQDGIDMYAVLAESESYLVAQCRRVAGLTPTGLRDAVSDFLAGGWSERTSSLAIATSASFRRTELADELERQRQRLREGGISLLAWGVDEISAMLKDRPELVDDFFHGAWRQAFCTNQAGPDPVEVMGRYRERVAARGSVLDLRPLGIDLAPLTVESPGTRVRAIEEPASSDVSRGNGYALTGVLRRRGRAVLLGAPGSGKSTAIRQLAAWYALRPRLPVPIVASLRRLDATRLDGIEAQVVDLATEDAAPQDAAPLRAALRSAIQGGDAVVLLDALDETGAARHVVTQAIGRWIATTHPATEYLLSTRDSAYASAATLGMPHLRLVEPPDLRDTLRRIALKFAERDGIDDQASWASARLDWAQDASARRDLPSSPLLRVLLVVLACEHDPAILPATRAEVLSRVVEDATLRLDITQRRVGEFRLEGLGSASSRPVVLEAFETIGVAALDEPVSAQQVEQDLAKVLCERWGLRPAVAGVDAHQLRLFWDEAGVFVATGASELVTAPNRLMAEIASARWISHCSPAEVEAWVQARLPEEGAREVLTLAAGLSPVVATTLVEQTLRSDADDLRLFAAATIQSGATVESDTVQALAASLATQGERAADPYLPALALARLPLTGALRRLAGKVFARLNAGDRSVLESITLAHWSEPAGDADSVERSLAGGPNGRGYGPGSGFAEVVLLAARRVAPDDERAARAILEASDHVATGVSHAVRAELGHRGHGPLVVAKERDRWSKVFDLARWAASSDAAQRGWLAFVRVLAGWASEPLTKVDARRLDELADFTASVGFMEMPYHWSSALGDQVSTLRQVMDVAVTLGGFSRGKLAAEAATVLELEPDEGENLLGYGAVARDFDGWDWVADVRPALDLLVGAVKEGPFFAAMVLACLETHPDRLEVLRRLRRELPVIDPESMQLVGRALVAWDSEWRSLARSWLAEREPVLQEVAAQTFGREARAAHALTEDLEECLRAPSLMVRSQALRQLGEPGDAPPSILAAVGRAQVSAPSSWTCSRCQTLNDGAMSYCRSCNVVGNDWAKWTAARAKLNAR